MDNNKSLAVKVVSGIVGFVAAVLSYPYMDKYVYNWVAFLGAIALGAIVYLIVEGVLNKIINEARN